MSDAFFSINLKGELIDAVFIKTEDEFLKQKIDDDLLISQILDRARDPKHYYWNFGFGDIHVEIVYADSSRIDFIVSTDEPDLLSLKRSFSKKITLH